MSDKQKLSYGSIGFLWQLINLIPIKNIEVSLQLSEVSKLIEAQRLYYVDQVEKIGDNKKLIDELNKKLAEVDFSKDNKKMLREELTGVYSKGAINGIQAAELINEINQLIKE
jgi:hypothetical protein